MNVHRFYTHNLLRNYDYIVELPELPGDSITVDPTDGPLIIEKLEKLELKNTVVFITHEHFDHLSGLEEINKKFQPQIYIPKIIHHKFVKSWTDKLKHEFESIVDFEKRVIAVGEGDKAFDFDIIEIPGHIPDHIGFIRGEHAFLGDTIFNCGVGNTRSGNRDVLFETIKRLKSYLRPETIIHSEHDYWKSNLGFALSIIEDEKLREIQEKYNSGNYLESGDFPTSSWGEELSYNPFLRTNLPQVREALEKKFSVSNLDEKSAFLILRKQRDNW